MQKCDCPKPCEQTIYEPALSHASLSVLSVDSILSEDKELLLFKYRRALEANQRINADIFEYDLIKLLDINRLYTDMIKFAENYLGDFQKSSLAKISIAVTTLVKKIFKSDLNNLLGDVTKYQKAYIDKYRNINQLIVKIYSTETKTCFEELDQLVKLSISQNETHRFLNEITEKCLMKAALMQEAVGTFLQMSTYNREESLASASGTNGYEPGKLNVKLKYCPIILKDVMETLETIGMTLEMFGLNKDDIKKERRKKMKSNDSPLVIIERVFDNLSRHMTSFIDQIVNLRGCLKEYDDVVSDTYKWFMRVGYDTTELSKDTLFSGKVYNFTTESMKVRADWENVAKMLYGYSYGTISKLKYLSHFSSDNEESSEVLSNIDQFIDKIKTELTHPLRQRVNKIRQQLYVYYTEALSKTAELEQYLRPFIFYEKSTMMIIWKVPSPNVEFPDRFHDKGREHWKVWNRDKTIADFSKTIAPAFIIEGLDSFCHPLIAQLDNFEEQLILSKQKLITAMSKIEDAYHAYMKKREIDHTFVL